MWFPTVLKGQIWLHIELHRHHKNAAVGLHQIVEQSDEDQTLLRSLKTLFGPVLQTQPHVGPIVEVTGNKEFPWG